LRRGIVLHVDGLDGVSGFVFGGVLLSGRLDKLTGRDLKRNAARLSKRRILSERIVGTDGVSAQHVSAEHGKERARALLAMHARVVLRVVQSYSAYGSVLGGVLLHEQLVNLESFVVVNELVHGAVVRWRRVSRRQLLSRRKYGSCEMLSGNLPGSNRPEHLQDMSRW